MSARKWLNANLSKWVIKNVASSGFTSLQIFAIFSVVDRLTCGKLKSSDSSDSPHLYNMKPTWQFPTKRECPLCEYGQLFSFLLLYSCWFFRLGVTTICLTKLWSTMDYKPYKPTSKDPNCPFKTLKACLKKLILRLRVVHCINRKLTGPRDLGPIQSQTRMPSVIWNVVGFRSSGLL